VVVGDHERLTRPHRLERQRRARRRLRRAVRGHRRTECARLRPDGAADLVVAAGPVGIGDDRPGAGDHGRRGQSRLHPGRRRLAEGEHCELLRQLPVDGPGSALDLLRHLRVGEERLHQPPSPLALLARGQRLLERVPLRRGRGDLVDEREDRLG
jgi:hypothetical protein